jgi:hypothetical protein
VTRVDPCTGKPGAPFLLDEPYEMSLTPDGGYAIANQAPRPP